MMLALALIGLAVILTLAVRAVASVAARYQVPRPPMTNADVVREAVRLVRERAS